MAAADGTYRIFARPSANDMGVGFVATGESYTGAIGDAFGFAQTLQDADPSKVFIPLVGYDVLRGSPGVAPSPVLNDSAAPVPIAGNRVSAVWEQNQAELDYLNATYGEQTWALQSYGPG